MYDLIYADPPWKFKTYSDKGMDRSPTYDLMNIEDIKNMGVENITAKDALLFIWVTHPFLPFVFDVINAWGFTYSTVGFTWIKTNKVQTNTVFIGQGYYTRSNPELCLIAKKGNGLTVLDRSISSVHVSPVREHSRKPKEIREKIELLVHSNNKLELFARESSPGWFTYGNETTKFDK